MWTLPCTSEVCSGVRKVCKLGVPAKASTKYQPVASQPLEKTSPRTHVGAWMMLNWSGLVRRT